MLQFKHKVGHTAVKISLFYLKNMNTSSNPEYIKALWFDLSAGMVGIDPEAL